MTVFVVVVIGGGFQPAAAASQKFQDRLSSKTAWRTSIDGVHVTSIFIIPAKI